RQSKHKSALELKPRSMPKQLRDLGESFHQLFNHLPNHIDITDTLDYLLGALYGLRRAYELDFRDRSADHHKNYRDNLAVYCLEIPQRGQVNPLWTAGFYFNSAIQRLASAFDRITQMFGEKATKDNPARKRMAKVNAKIKAGSYAEWEKIYQEVNLLKHPPSGLARGRTVTLADAFKALAQTLDLIEKGKKIIIERYPEDV
ncbi:MAG TPA: hypothetical protein VFA15_01825, partial [Nitrososphaera sp.]|nr:hypothetical protein [Nitrososphaera sp.]